jgi:hypothetical protein
MRILPDIDHEAVIRKKTGTRDMGGCCLATPRRKSNQKIDLRLDRTMWGVRDDQVGEKDRKELGREPRKVVFVAPWRI